jgi:hypothetical protein
MRESVVPFRRVAASAVLFAIAALAVIRPLDAASPTPDPSTLPAPPRVVVPRLQAAPTIDGELNEPVWRRAAVLSPFRLNDGSRVGREPTEVRIWYDDAALYLGWTCTDSDVQATFTARDSRFWEEEVAEFFVTAGELGRYFELQWNPLGGVFDAIITNELDARGVSRKFTGEWGYTARGMKSAVTLRGTAGNPADRDERWQVEARIPFADLERATPKPREVWRANFFRFNRGNDKPVEQLSWSPTQLPGFHQPSRFGYLEFAP